MLAPAPYSVMPIRRLGNFAWIRSAQGPNSPSLPSYQPKYLLKAFNSVHQLDGSLSLELAAETEGRMGSSRATSPASWRARLTGCGPAFKVISLNTPQQITDG